MINKIDELIYAKELESRSVILFGHCEATLKAIDYLLLKNIKAAAILDNNKAKQGKTYSGIEIKSPQFISCFNEKDSIVLIASKFFSQMREQLVLLGYKGEIIQLSNLNSFAEYSTTKETFERKGQRLLRGTECLQWLKVKYDYIYMVVCPYNALGDVYWAMSYIFEYTRIKGVKEFVAIVVGEGCKQVAEMFGVKYVESISQNSMDELVQALIYGNEKDCIIAHHDRPYTDNIIKYLNSRFLSFTDYYKYAVFGLPQSAMAAEPAFQEPFSGKSNVRKSKSLIISPYAKSIVNIPASFWQDVAKNYEGKQYDIYTNVAGEEHTITGTKAIRIPIKQMIDAVEWAGTFIGIRSGLCDIISTANCNKTMVFPNSFYSTTHHKVEDYFALHGWLLQVIDTG